MFIENRIRDNTHDRHSKGKKMIEEIRFFREKIKQVKKQFLLAKKENYSL